MANATDIKVQAEQYLTKMKAKFQTDTRSWERFANEVPDKFMQLVKSGFKPTISRESSGRNLSVNLTIQANMDDAKAYLQEVKEEIPRRGKAFLATIEEFDATLQKYCDAGLEGETLEKLAKHFAQWVDYASDMHVQIRDTKVTVEISEECMTMKKKWLEMADRQKTEEYAKRYGISVADVPKHRKYLEAKQKKATAKTSAAMQQAIRLLQGIQDYLDAQELIGQAQIAAEQMHKQEQERERIRKEEEEKRKREEEARKEAQRKEELYQKALQNMNSSDEKTIKQAWKDLKSLQDFRDCVELTAICAKNLEKVKEQNERRRREEKKKAEEEERKRRLEEEARKRRLEEEERKRRLEEEERKRREEEEERQRRLAEEERIRKKKAKQKRIRITIAIIALLALAVYLAITLYVIPNNKYKAAEALLAEGKKAEAAMMFGSAGNYSDAQKRSFALWDEVANRDVIAAGGSNHVGESFFGGITENGDPLVYDTEADISVSGGDYIAVAAGQYKLYFLRADGTVEGAPGLENIVDIASGGDGSLFALKSDGTVVSMFASNYDNKKFADRFVEWTNIIDLAAGFDYLVGLKADGTVVSAPFTSSSKNYYGEQNVGHWSDIVKIAVGSNVTVGLKSDGSVVAVGSNYYGTSGTASKWTDIVDITAFRGPVAGLRSDGTVVVAGASGDNNHGEHAAIEWSDIVMVESGNFYVLGIQADGTVLVAGKLQGSVKPWPDLKGLNP